MHGHRLCRDIAVVLVASIAIWIPDILLYFTVRLETGDSQDLKYGVYSIREEGERGDEVSAQLWILRER